MRRHRFDPGTLLAGLFFLGVAGAFLASGFIETVILPIYGSVPVLLVGLGVVGLVRVLTRSRRRD